MIEKIDTKEALIYTYAHLPEKLMYLSNPPKDITKDKYNDKKYLSRVAEMISELKENDFQTRTDSVLPYQKKVIIQHIKNRIKDLNKLSGFKELEEKK